MNKTSGTSIALRLAASLFVVTCLVSAGMSTVCSKNTGTVCEIFNDAVTLLGFVPLLVTRFVTLGLKLILILLVSLLTGNPLDNVYKFATGILTDVSGGLASAILNFVYQLGVAIIG